MEYKYLNSEWRDEAYKRIQESLTPQDLDYSDTSICIVYLNCDGGIQKYLNVAIIKGKVTSFNVGQDDIPESEFAIKGDYETFVKIFRNELNVQLAYLKGKIKLKGSMTKIMTHAKIFEKIIKVFLSIPTIY